MNNPTKSSTIAAALHEVGYRESPAGSNKTKFGAWYPMDGAPWCAMFVSWCFRNNLDALHGKYARTDTKAKALAAKGYFHKGSAGMIKGDIIFFNFGDSNYQGRYLGIVHTGIDLGKMSDGRFKTVEGNTSSGSNSNGGQVQIRYRSPSMIAGYFRPPYAPEPVAAAKSPAKKINTQKVHNAPSGLHVRSAPRATATVLATIKNGTVVYPVSIDKGWAKLQWKKGYAYVSSNYIH